MSEITETTTIPEFPPVEEKASSGSDIDELQMEVLRRQLLTDGSRRR